MKKLAVTLAACAILSTAPAFAMDLGYMVNPPKERSVAEIRTDLDKATKNNDRAKIAVLKGELAQKLQEVAPAAGPGTAVTPYGHVLAH